MDRDPNEISEIHKRVIQMREELEEQYPCGVQQTKNIKPNERYDSPYTMEDGTATFLYVIIMVIGTIFVDRLLIWIVTTIIYVLFKTRHNRKKK